MKGKKILVLGNGFDLAHGLPTSYRDFLEYCKSIYSIGIECMIDIELDEILIKTDIEIFKNISSNIWFKYLKTIYNKNKMRGENWIDFESEISFIISFIDKFSESLLKTRQELLNELKSLQNENGEKLKVFSSCIYICDINETIKDVRKDCFKDLEKLIHALELYLLKVDKENIEKLNIIENINPDYIINFNYTHTYERLYNNTAEVFHIHGECKETYKENEINNMVLGIDEYWSRKKCNKHTNFAIFKKFVQRIRKKTGTKHIEWLNEINEIYQQDKENGISDIYIFGHSLDITDKDILKGFFKSKATRIHIYCKDRETEGELIANVIKLVGEKNLLQKVNQIPQKIEFIVP